MVGVYKEKKYIVYNIFFLRLSRLCMPLPFHVHVQLNPDKFGYPQRPVVWLADHNLAGWLNWPWLAWEKGGGPQAIKHLIKS